MLVKSEAIVLRKTPYAENSAVVALFTKNHGILSFMVQGLHGKNSKSALLQPGNILEIVYYYQSNKSLKRIKEMKLCDGFLGYQFGPVQLQTMVFCLELLQKALPDEQEDMGAFLFATEHLKKLSCITEYTWFPLTFLLGFIEVNGLAMQLPLKNSTTYTPLDSGHQNNLKFAQEYLEPLETNACISLREDGTAVLDKMERRILTEKLLNYLRYQLFPEKELRSFPILMEVLD
ncbi:MAG: DNA repair protein RecO [Bacteroidia bacterium]|nr:DNA repair protein RecO [Bacteroidia bacterium]